MKIRPAGAQLFPTDGQTDKHDVTSSRSLLYERTYKNIGCNEKIVSLSILNITYRVY